MRIISHRDGSYSIVNLTRQDVQDLERAVYLDYSQWLKSSEAPHVPSHYTGWTLESYCKVNTDIAERMHEIANLLRPIVFPPY